MSSPTQRRQAVRAIVALYREFAQISKEGAISFAQYRTLLYLRSGPKRAGEIAAEGMVRRPTVSAMIASLRSRNWILERVDRVDGRIVRIELTADGVAELNRFEIRLVKHFESLFPGVDLEPTYQAFGVLHELLSRSKDSRMAAIERRWLGPVDPPQ